MHNFNAGQSVPLFTKQHHEVSNMPSPHDPSITFNRVVDQRSKNPLDSIWSPDINKFLKVLNTDDLSSIFKTTFVATAIRNGVGLWDMFFNTTKWKAVTACVLVAKNDFSPITQNRIVTKSAFVDMSRPVSRTYLNALSVGDRIGIAISDPTRGLTHVLLYEVEAECMVQHRFHEQDEFASSLPAVNVIMHHALRIDHRDPGNAKVLQMDETEYDVVKTTPFVEWLVDVTYDITHAHSWKPRFLPVIRAIKRKILETRLTENINQATYASYSEFEKLCRDARAIAIAERNASPTDPSSKRGNRRPQLVLPVIEVVTNQNLVYVNFENLDSVGTVVFDRAEMGHDNLIETYFTNQDLEDRLIEDRSDVIILSKSFGENCLLRYFTINL